MILASLALAAASAAGSAPSCSYDRAALLALDQPAFDQDLRGGWRALAAKGCDREAAELIRQWREAHRATDTILFWHEGQLRANAGDYALAIPLFERGRHAPDEDATWGWNLYVDGSIAFLRGDRPALEAARARLAELPRPADLPEVRDANGTPVVIDWPMNLHVLDALLRCWGQSYRRAYSCRPSATAKE